MSGLVTLLLPALLATLIAAAGWHYLCFSRAAARLAGLESKDRNRRRVRLRRINGAFMLILCALVLISAYGVNEQTPAFALLLLWAGVMLTLGIILALGLIDLRLTRRLRTPEDKENP